jgi:hypothetical protein
MPYKFSFDLSSLPKSIFQELAKVAHEKRVHRKIGKKVRDLVEKFKIQEALGVELSDALLLLEDLVDVYINNISQREKFLQTRRRALFLPHCARKHMDSKCQARFDPQVPSYFCSHCSSDCLVNKATILARKKGYDVYVLPGSSCIPSILKNNSYEAVVGVACSQESKVGVEYLNNLGLAGQAVPLIKNGCAHTKFNIQSLRKIL